VNDRLFYQLAHTIAHRVGRFLERQGQLAEAMGVSRKTVNELCTNRRAITADTALMLATVFGNTADFWLNLQQRNELWKALNTPKRRARIERAKPIAA
jgi:addiction module HigA family antidote